MVDSVPTAAPHELTFRVGWEVVTSPEPDMLTVRIRREPDPGDSDGIPQCVDTEVSLRGALGSDATTAKLAQKLSPAQQVGVLVELCELAFRSVDEHGNSLGDVVSYPILTPSGVRMLVPKFKAFSKWFMSLAALNFDEMRMWMGYSARAGRTDAAFIESGLAFLAELAELVPQLQQFDDTPHLLLKWDI